MFILVILLIMLTTLHDTVDGLWIVTFEFDILFEVLINVNYECTLRYLYLYIHVFINLFNWMVLL